MELDAWIFLVRVQWDKVVWVLLIRFRSVIKARLCQCHLRMRTSSSVVGLSTSLDMKETRKIKYDMQKLHWLYGTKTENFHWLYGTNTENFHWHYGTNTDFFHRLYGTNIENFHWLYGTNTENFHRLYGTYTEIFHRLYGTNTEN